MEKLKDMKIKHDHTLTDIVKVVVFWLFLIMPILVWMPTALYYGFNEHADNGTQTATATAEVEYQYKYETNEVTDLDDLINGHIYHFDELNFNESYANYSFPCVALKFDSVIGFTFDDLDEYILSSFDSNDSDTTVMLFYYTSDSTYSYTYVSYLNGSSYCSISCDNSDSGGFVVEDIDFIYTDEMYDYFYDFNYLPSASTFNVVDGAIATATVEYNNDNSIVNAMSYAWQQTWQTPVLSWTGNQNFNFTIQAFTNIFGITEQSYITNYLTYLLTMTAIYVIFDIVLGVFKLITHIVNEK